jgi:hypothetical protein
MPSPTNWLKVGLRGDHLALKGVTMVFPLSIPGLKSGGNQIKNEVFFDTLLIHPKMSLDEIKQRAREKKINLRYYENGQVRSCERVLVRLM